MPDLIVNARVTTLDPATPEADAVAIADGRIRAVGSAREAAAALASLAADAPAAGTRPRILDAGGRRIVPGLIDMHAHLDREGLKGSHPSMAGLGHRDDVLARIAGLARDAAPGAWIVTMPLGEPPFHFFESPEAEAALHPTRQELDAAAPDNPVYVRPIIGFWRWAPLPDRLVSCANSRAMAAVGLTDDSAAPSPSITLERDDHGRLTGRFFEATTVSILELTAFARAVRYGVGDRVEGLRRSMAVALGTGTTMVFEGHGVDPAVAEAYRHLHATGALAIRAELVGSPRWNALSRSPVEAVSADFARLAGDGRGDDRLREKGLFVNLRAHPDDRVRGAAGPYTGLAGYHFDTALPAATGEDVLAAMARSGMRAVGLSPAMLDAYARAARRTPGAGKGWLVQHCGHFPAAALETALSHGVGATFLPVEAIFKQAFIARESPGMARDWMPLGRVLRAGLPVSIATDNIPPSLFFALWCCLARRDRHGRLLPKPDGALSRLESLDLATLGAARCLGVDDRLGSIAPGKRADLAILDRDFLTCDIDSIPSIRSVATMVDGDWNHLDLPSSGPDGPARFVETTDPPEGRSPESTA